MSLHEMRRMFALTVVTNWAGCFLEDRLTWFYFLPFDIVNFICFIFINYHNFLKVCRNGMLKFVFWSAIRFPQRFPGPVNEDRIFRFQYSYILAPFWADINQFSFAASSNASVVYYHVYDEYAKIGKEVLNRANADVQRYQMNPRIPLFKARWILVVTWVRIYPPSYPTITAVRLISHSNCGTFIIHPLPPSYPTVTAVRLISHSNCGTFNIPQ